MPEQAEPIALVPTAVEIKNAEPNEVPPVIEKPKTLPKNLLLQTLDRTEQVFPEGGAQFRVCICFQRQFHIMPARRDCQEIEQDLFVPVSIRDKVSESSLMARTDFSSGLMVSRDCDGSPHAGNPPWKIMKRLLAIKRTVLED